MDSLETLMDNLSLSSDSRQIHEIIYEDIGYIVHCYNNEYPSIFQNGTDKLKVSFLESSWAFRNTFFKIFPTEQHLFQYMNNFMWKQMPVYLFTEVCPLIDEYIEYVFDKNENV